MDSEAEDTKSHLQSSAEHATPKKTKNKKKKKKKDHSPPPPPSVQAKIQVVHDHSRKTPPMIGYFPSGFDPLKASGSETEPGSGSTDFRVYRHREPKKQKWTELVVSPAGSPVEFVGTSYAGEAAAGQVSMYALGVFDKESQTLKVVPIVANKIFRLEPKVKGLTTAEKEPASSTVEEMTPQQKAVKIRQTTSMWGTKKEIEKAKRMLALKQDDDPNAQKNLDVKLKDVVVNKKALESTEAHVSRNIPPYDASATTPQEAYVLDKIILKGEWNYLEDIYHNLQRGDKADLSAYPTFVCNRLERLKKIKDESEKKNLSCIFSYINHLIKFKDQHSMDGAFSAKGHKIPNILRHRFSSLFAVSESKRLPSDKINLLISYVLVLTLFSDEFRTDYTDIAKDLRMSAVPVRQLYENLGCKILRQKNIWYATLSIPLQFPDLRLRKRRR